MKITSEIKRERKSREERNFSFPIIHFVNSELLSSLKLIFDI
jgi:hypothetical protein